jgi:hypothetical protein
MDDDGHAISYKLLQRGIPVHASDGGLVGTVDVVLDNPREQIFDGIVIDTGTCLRFVDAPEVARIAELRVTLSIDSTAAAALPEPGPGAPEYQARLPGRGPLAKLFGGGWKRRR